MPEITGVILAGGQASRYGGEPKGLKRVGGMRIIDRVNDVLSAVCERVILIANDPAAGKWISGMATYPDVRPGLGSLGGLYTALTYAAGPALVVAWDMPFVPAALLHNIRQTAELGNVDVVVPQSDSSPRGVEPLCAYYGPACLGAIERQLDAEDLRMIGFYDAMRVARVPLATVQQMGDPEYLFLNVNTPADLESAEQYAVTHAAAHGGHRRPEALG